jgi:endonuclease III
VVEYGGDAGRIWADSPSPVALQARLLAFEGIGQKKAAMAAEILERDLGVPISDLAGGDVPCDVHVRRVFLRTSLADADDVGERVADARTLNPGRPGSLDLPARDIGRRWCHPVDPSCGDCALNDVCPKLVDRADNVRGM